MSRDKRKHLLIGLTLAIIVGIVSLYLFSHMFNKGLIEQPQQEPALGEELEQPQQEPALRRLAEKCGLYIGAAIEPDLLNFKEYAEILNREFNFVTTENALKFENVHPLPNTFNFYPADTVVKFAEEHGMKIRGHCLVWHQQLPSWILEGNYTREEWINILHEHITTVVERYKGRIYAWDVVNEAIADNGSLRNNIWLQKIGPEYIELAFRWAHEADPDALLFYNDYGAEGLGHKSDAVYSLVKSLLDKGVPIHGVGLQMHVSLMWSPNPDDVYANIKRLGDLGLEVHITEMDVRIMMPATYDELIRQGEIYRNMLKVCLSAEECKAFILWGFTDRYSWIPQFFSGYGSALIFDENYQPKPAYYYLLNTLVEFSDS